jgi:uncharacterized protein YecT (DUF1311 family)
MQRYDTGFGQSASWALPGGTEAGSSSQTITSPRLVDMLYVLLLVNLIVVNTRLPGSFSMDAFDDGGLSSTQSCHIEPKYSILHFTKYISIVMMASRLNHDGAVPSSNHENTTETAAGQLISAINQIAGSSAYKLLNKLYEDNQSMKKDVQERTIISEKIMADLMNSRSEAADLKAKIRDLIEANEKLEREITQKKENIQILTEQRKNVDQELTKAYKKVKMHEADKEELLKKLEALPVLERRLKDTEASEKELKRLQLFAADLTDIQSVGDTMYGKSPQDSSKRQR